MAMRTMLRSLWNEGIPATVMLRFHMLATVGFFLLIYPSIMLWKDSVPYLVAISVWANFAGHLSAWQAARVEQRMEDEDG